MLTSQRTFSVSNIVHAPLASVLKALHDPELLISLGPHIASYNADTSDPDLYHITSNLTFLGVFHSQTTFTAKFTRSEDAMHSVVNANLGTRLENRMKAKSVPEGTEVTEEATIEAFFLLMPYIAGTHAKAHVESLANFAAHVERGTGAAP